MFDWKRFLSGAGIEYAALGRDEIGVRCPFCGTADSGERPNLSINLRGAGWKCWGNRQHKGRSRSYLIQALLGCSQEEAREFAGESGPRPLPHDDDFFAQLTSNLGLAPAAKRRALRWPSEFHSLLKKRDASKAFWTYLTSKRHYSVEEAEWASWRYNLSYAIIGPWAYRVVVPIYDREGLLINWTGRTIIETEKIRYKTLSRLSATAPPSETLLGIEWLSRLPNIEALVLCEGSLDAIRVTTLCRGMGIYGTCEFGLSLSETQLGLLRSLRFRMLGLALDQGTHLQRWALLDRLVGLPVRQLKLPVKDPAEFKSAEGREFFKQHLL